MSNSLMTELKNASTIKPAQKLSTGNQKLDKFLAGGLITEGITEICGVSGSGKSQLCLQLSLMAQYPQTLGGLSGRVIYICSEPFHLRRWQQLIKSFPKKIDQENKYKIRFSDNIFIQNVADYEKFENLFPKITVLVSSKNIKLLILDSVTALFRGSPSDSLGLQKAKELRTIAKFLYKLSKEYKVAIVCVNQVTQILDNAEPVPALGLVWENLVNTRIQLKKNLSSRNLSVIFSPILPPQEIKFTITSSGVED